MIAYLQAENETLREQLGEDQATTIPASYATLTGRVWELALLSTKSLLAQGD